MRRLPVVQIEGLRKVYVRRADVRAYLDARTFAKRRKYHREPGRASVGFPRQGSSAPAPLYPPGRLGNRPKEESMASLVITTRRTKSGPRYVVRYRLGGRAYPIVTAALPHAKEARARRDLVAGEIAAGRNPRTRSRRW